MRLARIGRGLLLAALLLGGCSPSIEEGKFACGSDDECPGGWSCHDDGRCYSTPQADGGTDAEADAEVDAEADADTDAGCEGGASSVDLLVMVDDSGSMAEEQASLTEEFPELVRALATGDVEPDGTEDFPPVEDLHVGVVTSDMGTAGYTVPSCSDSDFGDDGILQTTHGGSMPGCETSYPKFLSFRPGDGLSSFRMDFTCLATVGTLGCGFEQQLEAVLKAVTASTSGITFQGDTSGHADGANAGFLRDDSVVVVLVVTDEEDCSARDPEMFNLDSAEYGDDLSLRCPRNPDALHPITRYADGLRGLRSDERDVIFGAIVGVPPELENMSYGNILDAEVMQYRENAEMTALLPSCDVEGRGLAFPPRRIVTLARELEVLGSSTVVSSICRDDYAPAFAELLDAIAPRLEPACP